MRDDEQAPTALDPTATVASAREPQSHFGFYLSAVLCALFMVRVLGADWNTHFPAWWPDAVLPREGYLTVARMGPFRPGFYFAFRPIGYPAFLWAFARSSLPTVVAQTAVYCAAVIVLSTTAWRVIRNRVVAVSTIAVLIGVAMQAKYSMWNTQILSESLSMSFGFASIAAWWRFAAEPTTKRAVWGWVSVIGWSLIRDSNVVAALVMVPTVLLAVWLGEDFDRKIRRALLIGAAVLILTAGYSYTSQNVSGRSSWQFQDLIGVRVLTDAKLSSWFASHGMPLDDALRTRTGKPGFVDEFWRSKGPTFAHYFHWSDTSGRRTYALSLFALPSHYRDLFYTDLPSMLKADMSFYDLHHVYGRMPHEMPLQLGGPSTRKGLTIWLIIGAAALTVTAFVGLRRRRREMRLAVFGATALAVALAELFIAWFGDSIEIQRHAIGGVCALAVILVIVVATGTDAALSVAGTVLERPA